MTSHSVKSHWQYSNICKKKPTSDSNNSIFFLIFLHEKNAHSRKNEIKNFRATKNSQKEFPLFSGLHIFGAIFCSFGASWQHLCFIITYFVHHMIRALLCITVCISILHLFLSCYSALIPSEIGKKTNMHKDMAIASLYYFGSNKRWYRIDNGDCVCARTYKKLARQTEKVRNLILSIWKW